MTDAVSMYRYNVWANDRVLRHLSELPEEIYRKPIQSVFGSIADALAHIYIVDNVWLYALSGKANIIYTSLPQWQEEVKGANLNAFETRFADVEAKYEAFLLGQPDLEAVSEYPHPTHGVLRATYSEIIHHVVNHGTYHRGNITAMLRQLGHPGPSTDYVFYLYTKD